MAFTPINSTSIQVGKAIKKELWDATKDSLDDLDSRVTGLAASSAPIVVFNFPVLNASSAATLTGLTYYRAPSAFTLSLVQIEIFLKGGISSGILSIDVRKGATLNNASMTSVLTVQPSINFATALDYATATGTLNVSNQSVAQGDVLRLDVTSLPSTPLGRFRVLVYGIA